MRMFLKLMRMLQRQGKFKWLDQYAPCIEATTGEAPKISSVSRMNSRKLGRTLHLLSTGERVFAQLALYHPRLLDLHEQKMLSPTPCMHPLWGHPLAIGLEFPSIKGTLDVAGRIGFKHYEIISSESGNKVRLPFPYVGDLLIYLIDADGIPYAVNWSVKSSKMDFEERRRKKTKTPAQQKRDRDLEQGRHLLEKEYYQDAGIRTEQVFTGLLDKEVISNLDLLYGFHDRNLGMDEALLSDFTAKVKRALEAGNPAALVVKMFSRRWDNRDKFIARFYQDIWSRRLLVDMFSPIAIDRPLDLAGRDVIDVYASLFERGAK
ncbi:hypothetical protein [Pseudomonas sp. ML96]|uniref:hypothetical protein n=1 Tax=Pseudomonas sp. ML96 TaxID=1523503 RepID=UPI0005BC9023|nr:hypothetical protein [Pseudomonas sp. ML96]